MHHTIPNLNCKTEIKFHENYSNYILLLWNWLQTKKFLIIKKNSNQVWLIINLCHILNLSLHNVFINVFLYIHFYYIIRELCFLILKIYFWKFKIQDYYLQRPHGPHSVRPGPAAQRPVQWPRSPALHVWRHCISSAKRMSILVRDHSNNMWHFLGAIIDPLPPVSFGNNFHFTESIAF